MSIVYDISIKTPWNDKYYTKSVTNEFLIPLAIKDADRLNN